MSQEIMNTKEVASYLGLNEKRIYQLAKLGEIPATRIGGKWIFPRALMDQWILERAKGNLKGNVTVPAHILVVMGSNDFAWEILSHMLQDAPYHMVVSLANVGSTGGLIALEQGLAHVAGIHLFDPETGDYNLPYLPKFLKEKEVLVFHLFTRKQGLMVKRGNPLKIEGIEDLSDPKVRFVNRQKGSGTRLLLDYELKRRGISPEEIRGYHHEVDTHLAVAMEISAYSLKTVAEVVAPLMTDGGSIVGLDFDARFAWPAYNWMGVAKAALESTSRYLARSLGGDDIRVNIVAAGPIRTMAAKSIPGFAAFEDAWGTRAPLGWDVNDSEPIARACVALMSDWFPATTGEMVHVDGGYHAIGA
jgi:excisionase family DNA binding protein